MTTAVKHKQPRCFFNTCPFYITANELPDFGAEQENVIRRLAVYHTNSLPEVTLAADKWIHDNAMACVAWIVNEINSNLGEVELHERWYEDEQTEAITNTSSRESCQYLQRTYTLSLQKMLATRRQPFTHLSTRRPKKQPENRPEEA